ncbi:MAG: ComEA family DNA-binding protein [Actinomycetota bacterium]
MSTARSVAVPTIGWMLLQSSWMLTTAVPGPVLAWLGFLIIGAVGRMPRWIVAGVVLGAAALLARLPFWGQFDQIAVMVVYVAGMLLALAANPQWLAAQWSRATATGGTAQRAAVSTGGSTTAPRASRAQRRRASRDAARASRRSAQEKADRARTERESERRAAADKRRAASDDASRDTEEASRLAAAAGGSTREFFAQEPASDPVDVNSASVNEIADLPGMTRSTARAAVKLRDRQGGFRTLDAFAMAAGLQPHEVVRLRHAAVCSPPPRGRRSFGRRVDY